MTVHEVPLHGCTPEPLMSYLKALGILRLVAEQKDPKACGCWHDGVFVFRSRLDEQSLIDFFVDEYRPTPLVVPWSGGDFFGVHPAGKNGPYKKTPTSTAVIEAFLANKTDRMALYRATIAQTLAVMAETGVTEKKSLADKKLKAVFIARLRAELTDEATSWIDACALIQSDKPTFNTLLGSGGGSDGNTHFSDNFMQNLWEVLPDFDPQRKTSKETRSRSKTLLRAAVFRRLCRGLVPKRTSSLFDAGAVGGQNAGQGFERVSLGNPWMFVLCLEGALMFAGSINRRQSTGGAARAAFPFQVGVTATGHSAAVAKETAGREIWLPLWNKFASFPELQRLFSEGRATVKRAPAKRGVDFARAVASLGIDRGIERFSRVAIVRGRVGGDNYNTSTFFGHFDVRARPEVDLLREIDPWLDRFRPAATDSKAPPRFGSALAQIESAIFDFCQFGASPRFAKILCALGRAEREIAHGERFREEKFIRPISGLSTGWIRAANDSSVEFEVALALAGIRDQEGKLGPLRANLENAAAWIGKNGRPGSKWLEKDKAVVWTSADLSTNLAAVLERRLLDGARLGCKGLPLAFRRGATLDAVSAFIHGEIDDERIVELLWGLMLVGNRNGHVELPHVEPDAPPLPRPFALLRLLFLPHSIRTRAGEVKVKPEARILAMLRAGRIPDACAIAARRLRASGLPPMPHDRRTSRSGEWKDASGVICPHRLAASLLIPVSHNDAGFLTGLIMRREPESRVTAD